MSAVRRRGDLVFAAWALGLSVLGLGAFAKDHAAPAAWSGPALPLTLGRLAGTIAGLLLLAQLVLASRPRMLERRFGIDGLVRAHAVGGIVLLSAVALHVGLLGLGGAALTGRPAWPYTVQLATQSLPLLAASAGLVALLVLWASTAWRRLRRRHRRVWHGLHLAGYVAVALIVPHQVLTRAEFAGRPLLVVWWLASWAAAVGSAVVNRLVRPARLAAARPLTVAEVRPEAPGVASLVLRAPRAVPGLEPGGFVLLGTSFWRRHPFSVVEVLGDGTFRCTVEAVGPVTRQLVLARPGDRLTLTGVHGRFTADFAATPGPYLLIAAGLGVTAVRGLLAGLQRGEDHPDVVLLYRVRSRGPVLFEGDLSAARTQGVDVRLLRGSRHDPAVRADRASDIAALVPDAAAREWFVCGPTGFSTAILRAARQLGVPRGRVHAERFSLGP
jgi:ferredoxin-NADP reductase/DMSO/TMAO reductase YedYZ heme-binding membrane subunit